MGLLDDLALSSIDRVERSLGTRAALRALLALLETLPPGRSRARAVLRGVRYAAEVGDELALGTLTARWLDEREGRASDARRTVAGLLASGLVVGAEALAEAEVERTRGGYDEPTARYTLARCHEAAGDWAAALSEHEAAVARAGEQPRLRWHASARAVRALRALGRTDEASARAGALLEHDRDAPPEEQLLVAVAALEAPGRYRRATALDALERLAAAGRAEAIRAAARHGERAGGALSALEAERIDAVLVHHPREGEREAVRARVRALAMLAEGAASAPSQAAASDPDVEALLPRARAVAEGHAAGPRPTGDGRQQVGWLALAAVAAVRVKHRHDARPLLGELEERLRSGARVEAPCWTAAVLAVADERLNKVGRRLAALLLERDAEPPPAGFVGLAEALDDAGDDPSATAAWRRAAARREPGSRERLASRLRWRGWQAAEQGETQRAYDLLREAKRLAGGR